MMNRVNLAKSLVAARRIEAGELITADAVDIKSPGRGLQPNAHDRLVGRTAQRAFDPGDFFYATDLGDAAPQGRQYSFRRPWGLPVRYHDVAAMTQDCTPDFLEFHFSYKDLELDPAEVLADRGLPLAMGYACHSPDLFTGDFLLNLASDDDDHWERSVNELQRVIDLTRSMRPLLRRRRPRPGRDRQPGRLHLTAAHVTPDLLPAMYARVAAGLDRIDDDGVRLCAQTLPPFPWYMGGQLFCNLFVGAADTAAWAEKYDRRLCLDVSHSKLAATFGQVPFSEAVDLAGTARRPPAPRRRHRCRRGGRPGRRRRGRLGAARPAARPALPGRRLHPRDLAGPRQRRRGVLDRARTAGAVVLRPDQQGRGTPRALWAVPVSALGRGRPARARRRRARASPAGS